MNIFLKKCTAGRV